MNVDKIMNDLTKRNPGEVEFLQAVREVLDSIVDVVEANPQFEEASIIERIIEPDRVLMFKVPWADDNGKIHVNKGYLSSLIMQLDPIKVDCVSPKCELKYPEILRF